MYIQKLFLSIFSFSNITREVICELSKITIFWKIRLENTISYFFIISLFFSVIFFLPFLNWKRFNYAQLYVWNYVRKRNRWKDFMEKFLYRAIMFLTSTTFLNFHPSMSLACLSFTLLHTSYSPPPPPFSADIPYSIMHINDDIRSNLSSVICRNSTYLANRRQGNSFTFLGKLWRDILFMKLFTCNNEEM